MEGQWEQPPIRAYFYDDYEKVIREAKASCEVTHAHDDAQAGTIAIAVAAAYCARQNLGLVSTNNKSLLETAIELIPNPITKVCFKLEGMN